MKIKVSFLLVLVLLFYACNSAKNGNTQADAKLKNTRWKLIELEGKKIQTPEEGKEVYIQFSVNDNTLRGFGACNNFFGEYEAGKNSLKIFRLGSTEMACPLIQQESTLFDLISKTSVYEIKGKNLNLYESKKLLTVFEAVYLK